MAYSKIKKVLFILLCCLVIIFPFWCVRGLCAEDIEASIYTDRNIDLNTRTIVTKTSGDSLVYFYCNRSGLYTIKNDTNITHSIWTGNSTDIGTPVNFIAAINNSSADLTLELKSGQVLYIFGLGGNVDTYTVTFEPSGFDGSVHDLVDNVGISQLWNIFDISIDYIVIVVLVAFGIFIITRVIKKISKGKEGL